MKYDFFHDFSPKSRIWIYQFDSTIDDTIKTTITEVLNQFINSWKSHGQSVKAEWQLLYDHFIILSADEGSDNIGGCSIDSSVKVMKELSIKTGIDFFNRTNIAIFNPETKVIDIYNIQNLPDLMESVFFDNTVNTVGQWRENWLKPVKGSWLENFLTKNILI